MITADCGQSGSSLGAIIRYTQKIFEYFKTYSRCYGISHASSYLKLKYMWRFWLSWYLIEYRTKGGIIGE